MNAIVYTDITIISAKLFNIICFMLSIYLLHIYYPNNIVFSLYKLVNNYLQSENEMKRII